MNNAEQPSPELYRAAEKLRELADQSHLPDVREDLRELAARFERMAAFTTPKADGVWLGDKKR